MADKCMFCDFRDECQILKDYDYWTLIIAEGQLPLGWCIAFLKRHIESFEELTDKELLELKQVVAELKSALDKTFKPDWFNVMQLGNMEHHLHLHLVPRYKKPREFGGRTFVDQDYGHMIVDRWKPESKAFLTRLAGYIKENL